jgi:hypothetical protein
VGLEPSFARRRELHFPRGCLHRSRSRDARPRKGNPRRTRQAVPGGESCGCRIGRRARSTTAPARAASCDAAIAWRGLPYPACEGKRGGRRWTSCVQNARPSGGVHATLSPALSQGRGRTLAATLSPALSQGRGRTSFRCPIHFCHGNCGLDNDCLGNHNGRFLREGP